MSKEIVFYNKQKKKVVKNQLHKALQQKDQKFLFLVIRTICLI